MLSHIRANLFLLLFTVVLCSVLYPLGLWVVGQALFTYKAQGSLIDGSGQPVNAADKAVGSRLIGQPFTSDGYFQPRPSAASYNAAASGASNWGANNYLLRDRVARQIGPIVKYKGGPKKGQPAGPDVEAWFQKDQYQGQPSIVAQWASAHSAVAANWVKADKLNTEYVAAWMKANPDIPEQKPEDAAVPFFTAWSKKHPGTFPTAVEKKSANGKTEKVIEPAKEGPDIQGGFFDMWLQEHPQVDLEPVPADMVTASGSGLDPHITMKSALYQLDRVAGHWAGDSKRDPGKVRKEIESLLRQKKEAPMGGLVGVDLVNVLDVNLALRERYASAATR